MSAGDGLVLPAPGPGLHPQQQSQGASQGGRGGLTAMYLVVSTERTRGAVG